MADEKILTEMSTDEVLAYINELRERRAAAHLEREIQRAKALEPKERQKSVGKMFEDFLSSDDDEE